VVSRPEPPVTRHPGLTAGSSSPRCCGGRPTASTPPDSTRPTICPVSRRSARSSRSCGCGLCSPPDSPPGGSQTGNRSCRSRRPGF